MYFDDIIGSETEMYGPFNGQLAAIDTYVTLHKTVDTVIDGRVVSLNEIAEVLRNCTRLIVHTEADIIRLKTFGLVDNVVMIPPGVIDRPALDPATVRSLLNLRQFELFDPSIYSSSFVLKSLGDLLINSFLFCWIILFVRPGRQRRCPRRQRRPRRQRQSRRQWR